MGVVFDETRFSRNHLRECEGIWPPSIGVLGCLLRALMRPKVAHGQNAH